MKKLKLKRLDNQILELLSREQLKTIIGGSGDGGSGGTGPYRMFCQCYGDELSDSGWYYLNFSGAVGVTLTLDAHCAGSGGTASGTGSGIANAEGYCYYY
jgi:hypothetical protein